MYDVYKLKHVENIIKERVSIPYMYGEILNLRGDLNKGSVCCPFHQENTPSFVYSESLGLWTCFGECSKSGDVIELYRFYILKNKGLKISRNRAIEELMSISIIKPYMNISSVHINYEQDDVTSYLQKKFKESHTSLNNDKRVTYRLAYKISSVRDYPTFISFYQTYLGGYPPNEN